MKKRVFTLCSILIVMAAILISCAPGDNTKPSGSSDSSNDKLIYGESTPVAIIMPESENDRVTDSFYTFYYNLAANVGFSPEIIKATDEQRSHEIVFGSTERAVSKEAYRLLNRIDLTTEEESEGRPRILIYTDGSSIAIAYDNSVDDIALIKAINHLNDNYVKSSLSLKAGILYTEVVNIVAHYEAIDQALIAEKWTLLEKQIGAENGSKTTAALKQLYTIYIEELISWFANLYDPAVGGYYYSNSARNTPGYLPDADSTYQALSFISASGMGYTENDGFRNYSKLLPDWMKAQIVSFIKGLQHPNGYFYHPQWGAALTDLHTSRRARDLSRSVSVLKSLGEKPTYSTPTGVGGEDSADETVLPSNTPLTERLTSNKVLAVSKIIATAVAVPAHLENKEAFESYLAEHDINADSYVVGSGLVAQISEIIYRDSVLKEEGKDYSLVEILITWLKDKQLDNGLWEENTGYAGINGLMKVAGIFSSAKIPLPKADIAAEKAMSAMLSDENPSAITDVYNTWAAMNRIISSLRSGDDSDVVLADTLLKKLRDGAPGYIAATRAKLALFIKPDGSFSYNQTTSAATSQGLPAAVPGSIEGDVNATMLASSDIVSVIYSALKYDMVPIYTYSDWYRYLLILNSLQPVIKDKEEIKEVIPVTFDEEAVNAAPLDTNTSAGSSQAGGSIIVIKDPRANRDGNVLKIDSKAGGNDQVLLLPYAAAKKTSCFVFEGDFCVLDMESSYSVQIFLDNSYMVSLRKDSGRVSIVESSSNSASKSIDNVIDVQPAFGQWFNLRLEYFPGDENTVRARIYYNDKLVAVTDNYYNQSGEKLTGSATPGGTYSYMKLQTLSSADCVILLDDINAYKTDIEYQPITDPSKSPALNIDGTNKPIDTDTLTEYTFDDGKTSGILHTFYGEEDKTPGGIDLTDGKLTVNTEYGMDGFAILNDTAQSKYAVGTTYYFEADLTFAGGAPTGNDLNAAFIGLLSNKTSLKNGNMFAYGYISYTDTEGSGITVFGAPLEKGKTYRIRIEYTVGDGLYNSSSWQDRFNYASSGFKFYVDGTEAASINKDVFNIGLTTYASDRSFVGLGIYTRGGKSDGLELDFDNIKVGSQAPDTTVPGYDPDPEPPLPEYPDIPEADKTYYGNSYYTGTRYHFTTATSYGIAEYKGSTTGGGKYEIADGSFIVSDDPTWYGIGFKNDRYNKDTVYENGTVYVFETDFTYLGGRNMSSSDLGAAFVGFIGAETDVIKNDNMFAHSFLKYKGVDYNGDGDQDSLSLFGAELAIGVTYNLRAEYTVGGGFIFYVNGEKQAEFDLTATKGLSDTNFWGFGFYFRGTGYTRGLEVKFDNVFVGVTDTPLSDSLTPEPEPEPEPEPTPMPNLPFEDGSEDMTFGNSETQIPEDGWVEQ
ncbi:MAG: hypothetical protein J6D20_03630 [Clostridia bacterium]|nr:hypothetical protein [Clostridia bacterium]